ncbi:MAG: PKD domain-containing protein, partial [Proteobacteria bacterium]|nr:PKD domain-containing protein [Pseudomonadota bacterium]
MKNPKQFFVLLFVTLIIFISTPVSELKGDIIFTYPPEAKFSFFPQTGVAPLKVQFFNQSSSIATSLFWDFGDPFSEEGNSIEVHPSHTYNKAGTYYVTLMCGTCSQSDTATGVVTVLPFSESGVEFVAAPRSGSVGTEVQFTNLTPGEFDKFLWDFGDETSSAEEDPVHVYTDSGTYTVSLTLMDPYGEYTETKETYIEITTSPVITVEFAAAPRTGPAGTEVQFVNLTPGEFDDKFLWDFGDETSSTDEDPTHVYADSGTYTVSLTLMDSYGEYTETKESYIEVTTGSAIEVEFMAAPRTGPTGTEVQFTNFTPGEFDKFLWDFGDETSSTEEDPAHFYADPGIYTVSLTLMDSYGYYTKTEDNYIQVLAPPAGVVEFAGAPQNGSPGTEVHFVNLTPGFTAEDCKFLWDFGDGSSSTEEDPVHIYTHCGTFDVSLTLWNSYGYYTKTEDNYITISPSDFEFTWAPQTGAVDTDVQFIN